MSDLSQLSDEQVLAALQGQSSTQSSPSSAPQGASAPQAYPSQGDYQPNPAQSALAWQLYKTGGIKPGGQAGTLNQPMFSVPGRPAPAGSYIIDQGGKLRVAGENDDGSPQALAGQSDQDILRGAGMDPGYDMLHSILPGLAQGGAALAGMWGDLQNLEGNGVQQGGTWLLNQLGARTPDGKPLSVPGNENFAHENNVATSADANQEIQQLAGPYHQPTTWQGRAVDTLGQFAPAALLPGSAAVRVARVAVPAGASDAAGEATLGTPLEPWARLGGALLGGGVEGAGEGIALAPTRTFGKSLGGMTGDQIPDVSALRANAADHGIQLTLPEAIQQVTGGATNATRLQRLIESSPGGSEIMRPYFAQRPAQVQGAVMNFADQVAPGGQAPGMIAQDAQWAAQGAQMDANSQRAALAGPSYRAADAQTLDPQLLGDILENVRSQAAGDKTGLIAPRLNQFAASLTDADGKPISDIGNLSLARNYWRDQIDLPPTGNAPLTKLEAGMIGGHLDNLDSLLKANPDRAAGDAIYSAASRNIVDPLNAGPVGKIGATSDLGEQTGALYPQNPPLGQPAETGAAIDALNNQREGLAAALTRQHVANTFNQSARNLTDGPNQYGGAVFARNIVGNPEQAATLNAGLDAIDPTGDTTAKWGDLLEGLQATGRRERPGSLTAQNTEDKAALQAAPLSVRSFGNLFDPLEYGKLLNSGIGRAMYGRNVRSMAQMMIDPDTDTALAQALAAAQGMPSGVRALLAIPASQQGDQ